MQSINRICISRMKFIGDIVLTTPIVRAVRERYPDAYIAYLGDKQAVSLLENNPYLNEIIPFDFTRPTILEQPRVMMLLRRRKFDAFVDLFCNPRTAMLAVASGASIRIGKDVRGRGMAYTHRIPDYGNLAPAIEYHYQYVRPLGVEMSDRSTQIFLTPDERREARAFLQQRGVNIDKPIVALHPGATWQNKMWLKERFSDLANRLTRILGVEVLLSPGPQDRDLIDSILNASSESVYSLPVLPVRRLAAVLSECSVFVSNDCGPMHIGVAVGTPTLGIFGPEPPEVWFNYSEDAGHKALFKKISCSPCRTTKCHREGQGYMECMTLLSVEEVFAEVKRRLEV